MGMGSEACQALDYVKDGSMDGINEMGLAVHALELGESDGTKYDEPSTTEAVNISYMRWYERIIILCRGCVIIWQCSLNYVY